MERPGHLRNVPAASGAWVPVTAGADPADELLVLLRLDGHEFHSAELQVLASAACRMRSAEEALERANAIERLAEAGPGLVRHVDLASLLDEAVVLLRDLTGTDSAVIVTVADDILTLAAHTGTDESIFAGGPGPPARCRTGMCYRRVARTSGRTRSSRSVPTRPTPPPPSYVSL